MEISKLQSGIDKRSNDISGYERYLYWLIVSPKSYSNPTQGSVTNILQRLREEQTKDKRLMGSVLDQEWCVRNKKLYDPSKKYRKNVTKVSNKAYKIVWKGL